jgi:hypothetical protein
MKRWIGVTSCLVLALILLRTTYAQTQHGIQWSWNAVTTDTIGNTIVVDGYNLYCATSSTGPFTSKTNASLVTTTTYLETGVAVGSTNYCQVTAQKNGIESGRSVTSAGVVFQFPPVAPATPVGVVQ